MAKYSYVVLIASSKVHDRICRILSIIILFHTLINFTDLWFLRNLQAVQILSIGRLLLLDAEYNFV